MLIRSIFQAQVAASRHPCFSSLYIIFALMWGPPDDTLNLLGIRSSTFSFTHIPMGALGHRDVFFLASPFQLIVLASAGWKGESLVFVFFSYQLVFMSKSILVTFIDLRSYLLPCQVMIQWFFWYGKRKLEHEANGAGNPYFAKEL